MKLAIKTPFVSKLKYIVITKDNKVIKVNIIISVFFAKIDFFSFSKEKKRNAGKIIQN